jgi:hypothetical protein
MGVGIIDFKILTFCLNNDLNMFGVLFDWKVGVLE